MNTAKLNCMISDFQKLSNKENVEAKTFLDIIHKGNNEVYITELLAFLFNPLSNKLKSNSCVRYFLELLGVDIDASDEVQITTNKYARGDYIDLFIYVPSKLAVVIENKIWSDENGGGKQTQKYYEYCERLYKDVERKYVLLKPDRKRIEAFCNIHNKKQIYTNINYSQLVSILNKVKFSEIKDEHYQRILTDFIQHCGRFKMDEKLLDYETKVYLDNLKTIKYLENHYKDKLQHIKDSVCVRIREKGYLFSKGDGESTYRFYKKNWWDDNYFLYFEALYGDDLNKVHCQLTLKDYTYRETRKSETHTKFMRILDSLEEFKIATQTDDYQYYIFQIEEIKCNEELFISDYVKTLVKTLTGFALQAEKMQSIISSVK